MLARFSLVYERFCRIAVMVFVVNVAMFAHTLLGAFVGGFFPSVAAAHTVYRDWLLAEDRAWKTR